MRRAVSCFIPTATTTLSAAAIASSSSLSSLSSLSFPRRFLNIKKLDNIPKPSEVFAEGAADAVVDGEYQQGSQEMKEGIMEGTYRAWDAIKDTAKAAGSVLKDGMGGSKDADIHEGQVCHKKTAASYKPSNETFDDESGKPTWARADGDGSKYTQSSQKREFTSTSSSAAKRAVKNVPLSTPRSFIDGSASQGERDYVAEELSRLEDVNSGAGARADGNKNRGCDQD